MTGIYAADTMNQMPMAMMLMPCVVSCSGGTRYPCHVWCLFSRHHEPDTHAHDTDTMSGILDTHAADTMNQMPMELMPMQSIPMPFVASSGGVRLVIIAIYCTVDHAGTIHLCSQY